MARSISVTPDIPEADEMAVQMARPDELRPLQASASG